VFTGLVEDVGTIRQITVENEARRLTIATRLAGDDLPIGASLAVDGICLTVVATEAGSVDLVAAAETLARTALGRLAVGDSVNLERPLKLGDRLGGHLVAGHVDGVGYVKSLGRRGDALDITIEAPADLLRYVIEKGSITVDGISLTVNAVDDRTFQVSLIPHTQVATTLGKKPVGAPLNLEVDLIGKYVEKLVKPAAAAAESAPGGITLDKLKEHGFAQ
jgi:riboflavin synthase